MQAQLPPYDRNMLRQTAKRQSMPVTSAPTAILLYSSLLYHVPHLVTLIASLQKRRRDIAQNITRSTKKKKRKKKKKRREQR